MKILVTGATGFIGAKLMSLLAGRGDEVIGIDNLNNYYDVRLKYGRLKECDISMPKPDGRAGDKASEWPFSVACQSDCTGRCTVFYFSSVCLFAEQSCRFSQYTGGLPTEQSETFGVCFVQFGIRTEYESSLQ